MDILTYINRMNQIYGNEPAPAPRYNTQQYLQGGRVGYQSGQLVQPGPGRQGYAGNTAGFREDIITFKGKELPKGFISDKANEFGIDRGTASRIIDEIRPDIKELPYPENKEAKRKRLVVEKRLKKNFLDNAEFIKLHKNFEGSDLKFAEFLNKKGFTTDRGGNFTEGGVYARRERLELKTKTLPQSMSSYKTEAEKLGIDIKGLDDQTIKTRVRERRKELIRQQKRLTDPDFAAKETATRKAWEKANPEKVKESKFRARVKSYEKTGMIQPIKNAKEELWRSLFEDGKKYESRINRNLPARLKMVGDYGRYVSRERFLNAKILDTKTGKTITFKNLENYINPKNTGKTYAQVIKPFDQKWFVNDTPGLRTEINSKLIPNWTSASKDNFFEIQHNAGRYNDPFDVSLSNESLNLKESQVRTKFEKMWNASDNLSDKKKAFKFYKENLPNEILSKPSMVTRSRYFGEEVPLDKQLRTLKKESGVNLPRGTLKKVELLFQPFCGYTRSGGGRIGFSKGSCPTNVAQRNFLMATDDVAKGRVTGKAAEQITKNAGKVVAKAGSKSALASILGPAGFGLDIAFEVGSIGTDMAMDSNVTLKGALQNNWLTGFFMKGTGQEEYHKGLFAKDSSAKPFGTAMDLYAKIEQEEKNLKRMKTGSDRATTTEAMLNAQKQKIADLSSFFDKLSRKEGGRYLALEKGSPEQVAYERAKLEYDSTGAAKALLKRTSKAGFEDSLKTSRTKPYEDYGKTLNPTYGVKHTYGNISKKEIDKMLKAYGDEQGFGWTPYGLGYGMEQRYTQPGIGDRKYNEDLAYRQLAEDITNTRARSAIAEAGGIANMAGGGRVAFKFGGIDKGRRAFLKFLAALGIGGATAGTGLIKLSKGAKTVVPKVTEEVIKRGADGTPVYIADLIKVVKAKGIKKIMDSDINKMPDTVHTYKGVDVTEDAAGNIKIKHEHPYYSQQDHIQIEKGQMNVKDEGLETQKSFQEPDEYIEGTVRPDMDGKFKDFEEGLDEDTHEFFKDIADEVFIKKAEGGLASYDNYLPGIDDID